MHRRVADAGAGALCLSGSLSLSRALYLFHTLSHRQRLAGQELGEEKLVLRGRGATGRYHPTLVPPPTAWVSLSSALSLSPSLLLSLARSLFYCLRFRDLRLGGEAP